MMMNRNVWMEQYEGMEAVLTSAMHLLAKG
eukprot:SAG11_NODE_48949_length_120_cov_387.809524_1_plen_29_part_10